MMYGLPLGAYWGTTIALFFHKLMFAAAAYFVFAIALHSVLCLLGHYVGATGVVVGIIIFVVCTINLVCQFFAVYLLWCFARTYSQLTARQVTKSEKHA